MQELRKIHPKTPPQDICQRSSDWLKSYAKEWFKDLPGGHGSIWFADDYMAGLTAEFPPPGTKTEIVFTGSFVLRLLESALWPFEHFRLWVFSSRVKEVLIQNFQIPGDSIGIIGRKEFPVRKFSLPEANLIYVGRLSPSKNITGILRLTSLLQKEFDLDLTLDLFGDFDDFADESQGRFEEFTYKNVVKEVVDSLPWKHPPVFHGDVPQYEWTKVTRKNPVFISLSTSMYEDFGTAAAIAGEHGWPLLLSDWGGHSEFKHSHFFPVHLVPQSYDRQELQHCKARALAAYLVRGLHYKKVPENEHPLPKALKKSDLADHRERMLAKWLPEILLCMRKEMAFFADTPKGTDFFKTYRHIFADPPLANEAMIFNDLKELPAALPEIDPEKKYDWIYVREAFSSSYLLRYSSYEKITLFGLDQELLPVVNFLKKSLSLSCPLVLHSCSPLPDKSHLSERDQVISP